MRSPIGIVSRPICSASWAARAATSKRHCPSAPIATATCSVRPGSAGLPDPYVVIDNEASSTATILEIHAIDAAGVLFRIADVLADAGLDIRHAKISTLGAEVIDTFYVVTGSGDRVTDATAIEGVTTALMAAITDRAT